MMLVFLTHHIGVLYLSHVLMWCYFQQTAITCNSLWTGCSHTAWAPPSPRQDLEMPGSVHRAQSLSSD